MRASAQRRSVTGVTSSSSSLLEPCITLRLSLLPRSLRRQAVVEQFDVARFVQAVADLRPERAGEAAAAVLIGLVV